METLTRPPAEELAYALDARPVGPGRWMARCPCHDDRSPSLSIREGPNGEVWLKCFAGCRRADIWSKLGLTHAPRRRQTPVDYEAEWRRMPRRLAHAVVYGPPQPRTHRALLKQQYRETAWCFRWLGEHLDTRQRINLYFWHSYRLAEMHAALCGPKPFIRDATRKGATDAR